MDLLHQKPGKPRRSPSASSVTTLPAFPTPTNPYPPVTAPTVPIKIPSTLTDYSPVYQDTRPNAAVPIYGDQLVSSGDNVFEAGNTTAGPLYSANYSPTNPAFPNPSEGQHINSNAVFQTWGWNSNESWRQYTQSISSIVENLDPSETYASSALIALNQDCQNFTNPSTTAVAGLSLLNSGVAGHPVNSPPTNGGFHNSPQNGTSTWPAIINSFTYADSSIRGAQEGSSASNNG
jgi:hypothetical protein